MSFPAKLIAVMVLAVPGTMIVDHMIPPDSPWWDASHVIWLVLCLLVAIFLPRSDIRRLP